ncbi:MAG TPA: YugN-like family protein [Bacillales bacterium]|nr:YugN-like family protein [Bacillales bacterium]
MIQLESQLEGTEHSLFALEEALEPLGFVIGDNWQYDHGYFDYKINEKDGYLFLRFPFVATEGALDTRGVKVKFGTPYLLNHKYEAGLDQEVGTGVLSGFTNQFQEPVDKDDHIPEKYAEVGQQIVKEAEDAVFS